MPLVALVCAAALLQGCQKVVKTASTSVSPCFRVLPEAHAAVGGQGKFVDVARVQGRRVHGSVEPHEHVSGADNIAGGRRRRRPRQQGRRDVCVVAYSGTFDPSRIQHLVGRQQGKYAIVIVGVTTQTRPRRAPHRHAAEPAPRPLSRWGSGSGAGVRSARRRGRTDAPRAKRRG